MKNMLLILVVFCVGCSPFELRQSIFGMKVSDMKRLDNKIFSLTLEESNVDQLYEKTLTFLKNNKIHSLQEDRKNAFIVANGFQSIYPFSLDTTRVAIHLEQTEKGDVKVDLASRNHDLAEKVSDKFFAYLKK